MNAQQALADAEARPGRRAVARLVKATVFNGQGELMDLSIAAAAVDPEDPEETARTIADLVLAKRSRMPTGQPRTFSSSRWKPFAAQPPARRRRTRHARRRHARRLNLPSGLDLSGLGIGAQLPHDQDPDEDRMSRRPRTCRTCCV